MTSSHAAAVDDGNRYAVVPESISLEWESNCMMASSVPLFLLGITSRDDAVPASVIAANSSDDTAIEHDVIFAPLSRHIVTEPQSEISLLFLPVRTLTRNRFASLISASAQLTEFIDRRNRSWRTSHFLTQQQQQHFCME